MTGLAFAQIPPEDLQKIEKAIPAQATVKSKQPRRLLVFTRAEGYKHSSIPYAAQALALMGKQTGAFIAIESAEMSAFTPENLRQFDAVFFASTTQLAFEDLTLRQSLMEFVKSGKGVIGIHAATDNFYNWPEAGDMMGGHFDNHPWQANGTWAVKIADPSHPLNAGFQNKDFQISDEIYRIRPRGLRQNARVLVALDMADQTNRAAPGVRFSDRDVPISWVRDFGKGRVFYSSFGHNHAIYWNPAILRHFLAGIQFALGDLPVNTTPLPCEVESTFAPGEIEALFAATATYEYGQSREPLVNLNEYLRFSAVSPKLQRQNEKRLLQILTSRTTLPGKQFVCEQLSLWGAKQAVPVLKKMLSDSTTAEMARFALERIADPAAGQALREALTKVSGKSRVGMINTLGARREAQSVPPLEKLATATDFLTAAAAIKALGTIGGAEAAKILARAQSQLSGDLQALAGDAYLKCADQFFAHGEKEKAAIIYAQLNSPKFTAPLRYAAMRGMARTRDGHVAEFILQSLQAADAATQNLAASLAHEMPLTESVAGIAAVLPDLAPANQVQLLTALAKRQDAEARQAVMAATQSPHAEVREAAVQALGKIGDDNAVLRLAKIAAQKGEEAATARKSLHRLRGPAIDETIVKNFAAATPEVKVELILAANQRRIDAATPALLQLAKAPEPRVRWEAINALKTVADDQQLTAIMALLVDAPNDGERGELEKTAIAVALKSPSAERRSEVVMARLQNLPMRTPSGVRESLLHVLGGIGDPAALPVLLAALNDTAAAIKTAAILGLADWPNAEPAPQLLAVAEKSKTPSHQILALRGFVRLLRFESAQPTATTIKKFQRAMELAAEANEQKMILGWLAEMKAVEALEMALRHQKNEALRADAEIAAVKIAGAISGSHPAETQTLLQQLLQNATTDTLPHLREAQTLLKQIEQLGDYLTAWLVSEAYTSSAAGIFDDAFPPEPPEKSGVKWQVMPASTDPATPGLLQLDKVLGGENRAAYLRTEIWSEQAQRAKMELGSDDGVKVWLNGELVHANNASRVVTPGDDVFAINLQQGRNSLLLKITQGAGGWGACARLRNLAGGKLTGVRAALPELKN